MSSRSSSERQKKKKKNSPAPSPQKPTTTVAALFRKQLQQQQRQQDKNDSHANSTDQGSDNEDVAFVREEQTSVYFSSSKSQQRDDLKGENFECVKEEGSHKNKDGSTGTDLKMENSRPGLNRRLSHRLSLRLARQEKENPETKQAESQSNTPLPVVSDQGDGNEKSSSLESTLVHSRCGSAGSVSEAASTSGADCSRKSFSGTSFEEQATRKGDAAETSSNKCETVDDGTFSSLSSRKGRLSLKRKRTSQDPRHDAQSSTGLSSPKAAKFGRNIQTPESSSSETQAAENRSSASPVFSIFKKSPEGMKSPEKQLNSPGNRVPTKAPTLKSSNTVAGDETVSPTSLPSVTRNTETSLGQGKKLSDLKDSGEASANKTRGGSRKPTSSEADEEEGGEKAEETGEDDGEDAKEETLYRVPYYLENFTTIMKSVFADDYYVQLFSEEDLSYIEKFNKLSEEAQKLYVRLFSRKLAWLPTGKIRYPDIATDLTPYLQELTTTNLLASGEQLDDLSAVLAALSAPDLRTLAKAYHINPMGQQKGQIIQTLVAKTQQSTTVASLFGQKTGGVKAAMLKRGKHLLGPVYRLVREARAVFVRAMMLFSLIHTNGDDDSGSGGQGQLFQMLLVNMGRVVYPSYTVSRHTAVFSCRQDLIRFEEALQMETELLGFTSSGNWKSAYTSFLSVKQSYDKLAQDSAIVEWDNKLPEFLRCYTAGSVLVRLLNQGIEILQRRKEYHAAVTLIRELLAQSVYNWDLRGYWWDRLALNLDVHLKQAGQALQVIQEALADRRVRTGHRLSLFQRAETICSKPKSPFRQRLKDFVHEPLTELPKVHVEGRVLAHTLPSGARYQFITNSATSESGEEVTMCNVEQVVLDHYKANGFPQGIHAEGSVVSTLFCLFFWDALFMEVADAFHSPFQTTPLDLHTDAFYERRQKAIDQRLAAIESSDEESLHAMLAATWEKHNGVMCAGINWERFTSVEEVQSLVSCMGGRVVSGVLHRYAQQPRHTRSGFPDLTLWNTATKQLKICEVKGPGDRLSHKQMLWLDFLLKLGVDAEVCHVKPVGVKKLKPVTKE